MRNRFRLVLIAAALLVPWLAAAPASASRAVPKPVTGCVIDGFFVTHDGYRLRPWLEGVRTPHDFTGFEGRMLTLDGSLLPGDGYVMKAPPRDVGPCPDGIRKAAQRTLPWAWRDRSRSLREAGDVRGALAAIDKALALDPTLCIYGERAIVLEALGRVADAVADLTHASTQADCRDIDRTAAKEMLERLRKRAK